MKGVERIDGVDGHVIGLSSSAEPDGRSGRSDQELRGPDGLYQPMPRPNKDLLAYQRGVAGEAIRQTDLGQQLFERDQLAV
jgi:hypothetical protein